MRDKSTYRSAKRTKHREARKQRRQHQRDLVGMASQLTPEQARMALGLWAASGGKVNVLEDWAKNPSAVQIARKDGDVLVAGDIKTFPEEQDGRC